MAAATFRGRDRRLCLSEIMTILIAFHQSAYRNFKWFYTQLVRRYWHRAFPALVTYNPLLNGYRPLSYPYVAICASALVSVRASVLLMQPVSKSAITVE